RVNEDTDLRDRKNNYDTAILGNSISFKEAHEQVTQADPELIEARREAKRRKIAKLISLNRAGTLLK
ncbi:MAG: hypothetical protein JW841_11015, partial [Deltaproteobacteria bacterium]|nr:hypothetical protein [Deltaproteobacteria bacterium]